MFLKKDLVLGQEYLAFLLLNLLDLFLTGWMFKHKGMEANGIANWILTNPYLGLRGFALFKFLMVVFIVVICEVIGMASIRKARIVITTGCLVYLLVVMWEAYLIVTVAPVFGVPKVPGHHIPRNSDSLLPTHRWTLASQSAFALSNNNGASGDAA